MACISAETGTLTFAIINLVLVILSSLSGLGLLIFWGVLAFFNEDRGPESRDTVVMYVSQLGVILALLTSSLISLLFASFLMNGILKKKPEHLKVYYIFGIVKIVVSSLFFIGVFVAAGDADPGAIIILIAAVSIYSLILYMIRYTYVQYELNRDQYGHKHLVEQSDMKINF